MSNNESWGRFNGLSPTDVRTLNGEKEPVQQPEIGKQSEAEKRLLTQLSTQKIQGKLVRALVEVTTNVLKNYNLEA